MKDIVIKKQRIKVEFYIFLACVVAMELLNVYAIVGEDGKWAELFISLGYVCVAAAVVYVVLAVVRLVVGFVWHKIAAKGKKRE